MRKMRYLAAVLALILALPVGVAFAGGGETKPLAPIEASVAPVEQPVAPTEAPVMSTEKPAGPASAPALVEELFSGEDFEGYSITAFAQNPDGTLGTRAAAAILSREGRNVLFLLDLRKGEYRIVERSAKALRQGSEIPKLRVDGWDGITITYPLLWETGTVTYYAYLEPDIWRISLAEVFREGRSGEKLRSTVAYTWRDMVFADYTRSGSDYNPVSYPVEVRGKPMAYLASFDIEKMYLEANEAIALFGMPVGTTEEARRDPLPEAAIMTTLLAERSIYLAPDEQSAVGRLPAGTAVAAYARVGNLALITYDDKEGRTAFGYVAESALDGADQLPELLVEQLRAGLSRGALLTDTPFAENPNELSVQLTPARYLGTLGDDWCYIEATDANGARVRGFAKEKDLWISYYTHDYTYADYAANGTLTKDAALIDDPYRFATPNTLAELSAGTEVAFLDNLYGDWVLIRVEVDGKDVQGFVPYDALDTPGGSKDAHG